MANYAQTVNVIGAIKTTKTAAAFDTTGPGAEALPRGVRDDSRGGRRGAPEPLDVAAAWREDGKALTLSIVNPTREAQTLALGVTGATFAPDARLWRMTGTDEKAYNEPGKPPAVSFTETKGERVPAKGALTVPPMSISLYELEWPGDASGQVESPEGPP